MGRVLLAGILSGLAVFAWGIVSWFMLPLHLQAMNNLPQAQAEADAFFQALPKSGVYHYPGLPLNADGSPPSDAQMKESLARFEAGPRVSLMVVQKEGAPPMPPSNFIFGILLHTLGATMIGFWMRAARLASFGQRFAFALSFGIFVMTSHYLPETIWSGYPPDYAAATLLDIAAGAALIGLITGSLIRPAPVASDTMPA